MSKRASCCKYNVHITVHVHIILLINYNLWIHGLTGLNHEGARVQLCQNLNICKLYLHVHVDHAAHIVHVACKQKTNQHNYIRYMYFQ